MEKGSVHFSLGEGAGALLINLAREKFFDLKPYDALKILTDSLVGMPTPMAISLLKGDKLVLVDCDESSLQVVERKVGVECGYEPIHFGEWYSRNHKWIGDKGRDLHKSLQDCLSMVTYEITNLDFKKLSPYLLVTLMKGNLMWMSS